MVRLLLLMVLFLAGLPAHADAFYRLVGYTCDQSRNELRVYYRGAWNEAGEAMFKHKTSTEWDPDTLIASMTDEDHIGKLKTIRRTCVLSGISYEIRLGPTPGNFNISRRCGGVITAWAEVRRGKSVIVPHHEFEGDCLYSDEPITTEIKVGPRLPEPQFTKVARGEFLK